MDVLLHIGQWKTGTSYLQTVFSGNTETLKRHNILYPSCRKEKRNAERGLHVKPNVMSDTEVVKLTKYWLRRKDRPQNLFFSQENLFGLLTYDDSLLRELSALGVNVKILCFTRCPVELLQSCYAQVVKALGYSGTFEEYVKALNYTMPLGHELDRLINSCDSLSIDISLYNYSQRKKETLSLAESFMQLEGGTLKKPQKIKTFNRTLTPDELLISRMFNKYFGKESKKFFTMPLMNLTEIRAEKVIPKTDILEKYIRNINEEVEFFNKKYGQRFDQFERVNIENVSGTEMPEKCTLSPQQVDAIALAMSSQLKIKRMKFLKRVKNSFARQKPVFKLPKQHPFSQFDI